MSVPAVESANPPAPGTDANAPGRTGATNAQELRADPNRPSSAETEEQTTRGPDYFRQAFQRIRGQTQTAAPAPNGETQPAPASSPGSAAPPASGTQAPESERSVAAPAPDAGPATTLPQQRPQQAQPATQGNRIVLTPEELQRQVQAEADRILAKRQKDEREQAARANEVELRRTNPFEYARLMEAKEQELLAAQQETQTLTKTLKEQLFHYDRNILDLLVGALPEAERPKVISKVEGIPGRKATAEATLQTLRSRWLAEGRASAKAELMKDQTFIKEVLARFGQAAPEPDVSPVQARPASSPGRAQDGSTEMNDWMRNSARSIRSGV